MKIKKNEMVAEGVSLEDAKRMKKMFDEIGTLPFNQQLALLKMSGQRLKKARGGAEMVASEEDLYKKTRTPKERGEK